MGKLVEVVRPQDRVVKEISLDESVALYGLSVGDLPGLPAFSPSCPRSSSSRTWPVFTASRSLGQGNTIIMMVMMVVVMLFPLSFLSRGRGVKLVDPYLGGANIQGSPGFTGSGGAVETVSLHNYYLGGVLNEVWLSRAAVAGGSVLLAVMLCFAIL